MQRELFNFLPRSIPSVSLGGMYQSEMTTPDIINILMKLPVVQKIKCMGNADQTAVASFCVFKQKKQKIGIEMISFETH